MKLYDSRQEWRWKFSQHKRVYSILPRKCMRSGESLWFKKAWRIHYDEWADEYDEWYCEREYLWMKLKEST